MGNKELIKNLFCWYFVIIFILSTNPILYKFPGYNGVFYVISVFIIGIRNKFNYKLSRKLSIITFLVLSIIAVRAFFFVRITELSPYLSGCANSLLLISIFFISQKDIICIVDRLILFFKIIIPIGLFFFTLHFLGIDLIPAKRVIVESSGREYNFYIFFSTCIIKGEELMRFQSILNEPGLLGTIGAFILAIKKFDLKDKGNLILFIGCIFTLSMSFYVLTFVYFLLDMFFVRNYKTLLLIVSAGALLMFAFFLFPNLFNDFIEKRFVETKGGFEDGRANISSFVSYYDMLQDLDFETFLFGEGNVSTNEIELDIAHVSWAHLFIRIGGVLFASLIISLLYQYAYSKNKYALLFIVVFILSINHRPQIFYSIYFLLLHCGMCFIPNDFKHLTRSQSLQIISYYKYWNNNPLRDSTNKQINN